MSMKRHVRGPGTSRNFKVMKLHMVSVDLIKLVKKSFISVRLAYFFVHLILLIPDKITNTEQYSRCKL